DSQRVRVQRIVITLVTATLEFVGSVENAVELFNRAHTRSFHTRVNSLTRNLDPKRQRARMRRTHHQPRRLHDDRGIGTVALHDRSQGTDATALFTDDAFDK